MLDFVRWHNSKRDISPGSLVYAGVKRDFAPYIEQCTYSPGSVAFKQLAPDEPIKIPAEGKNLVIVTGVHDLRVIQKVESTFSFSKLALEDVMNTGQRPKFEWVDDNTAFIVVKAMHAHEGAISFEQVSLFWQENTVVVFLETAHDLLHGVLARINKGKGRIRNEGGAYLLSTILDALVDRHMTTLGQFGDLTVELETRLEQKTTDELLGQIYGLKRELIMMQNMLFPTREVFKCLLHEDAELPESLTPFLRDIAEHLEQVVEGAESMHDILTTMLDYQISLISIRTNNVMQLLTIIATIFIPLTFIAGIYGMNFEFMPELHWRYGYFLALGIMGGIAVLMLAYFARKRLL